MNTSVNPSPVSNENSNSQARMTTNTFVPGSTPAGVFAGNNNNDASDLDVEMTGNEHSVNQSYYVEGTSVPVNEPAFGSGIMNSGSDVLGQSDLQAIFAENVKNMQSRLYECDSRLAALSRDEAELFSMRVETDEHLQIKERSRRNIALDINYWKEQAISTAEHLNTWRKAAVDDMAMNARVSSLSRGPAANVKDHTAIPSKELPVFNIKRSPLYRDSSENNRSDKDSISLDAFIRKFERVYLNHGVDIKTHWFFHLEACLEKNDLDHAWFQQNVKIGYLQNQSRYNWDYVKELLKQRFDNSSIVACNQKLYNCRQKNNESLSEYLDKFLLLAENSKVNVKDNFFFTMFFIGSLFTTEFQDKVRVALVDYMKAELYQNSSMRSIHATDDENDFHSFYGCFHKVVEAIRFSSNSLEEACASIQRNAEARKGKVEKGVNNHAKPDYNDSARNTNSKKRKVFVEGSGSSSSSGSRSVNFHKINWNAIENPYHNLNSDEKNHLINQRKCLGCRTQQFDSNHAKNCSVRKTKK